MSTIVTRAARRLAPIAALAAAAAGCGTDAEPQRPERAEDAPPPDLVLSVPTDGESVRGRSVVVEAEVQPPAVRPTIDGDAMTETGPGRYERRMRLERPGENDFTVKVVLGTQRETKYVTVTRERTAAERAALRERREREREQLIASAQAIPYEQLAKNPDRYAGDAVTYTGQIFQIQDDGGSGIMLLSVTNEGYGFWDDNVWVNYDQSFESAEEDVVTVYGRVVGERSYETQAGGETYVPEIDAELVVDG